MVIALAGCVRTVDSSEPRAPEPPGKILFTFQPRIGLGYVHDSTPDFADGRRTAIGANLAAYLRLQEHLAVGLGLDSTALRSDLDEYGGTLAYNSYGGAFEVRYDTGPLALTSYFAFYFGEREQDPSSGSRIKDPLRGPGAGVAVAYRIGLGRGVSFDVGPHANFFSQRIGDTGERIRNVSLSIVLGITLGAAEPD